MLLHEVFQQQDGVLVVDGLQMLADGLPADGVALQCHLGFLKGERVALDGIGRVGPAHDEVFPQVAYNCQVQRATLVQRGLEAVDVGEGVHGIGHMRL